MNVPDPTRFTIFTPGPGAAHALQMTPRLESWDRGGSRSQVELSRYLDHVVATVGTPPEPEPEPSAAVELTVGLDASLPLLSGGRDLDNYLYPVVRRLGWDRFVLASAIKRHGTSSIRIAAVFPMSADRLYGWNFAAVETRSSTAYSAWKGEIVNQLVTQVSEVVTAGSVDLQLCFRVSRRRNWAYLWKPTIDALGVILGEKDRNRPFHPDDDRILRLDVHRVVDADMGNRVQIGIWWRPTPTLERGQIVPE